jgi:hypothetical protein
MSHGTTSLARSTTRARAAALLAIGAAAAAAACGNATLDPPGPQPESVATSRDAISTSTQMPARHITPDGTIGSTFPGQSIPGYMGGSLVSGTAVIEPIFYGTAWQPYYQSMMLGFLQSLSTTSYWKVVESYSDAAGHHPGDLVIGTPMYQTDYKFGRTLPDNGIQSIVQEAVTRGNWPIGATNIIYVVFTADDVLDDEQGNFHEQCVDDIGFHWFGAWTWTNLIPATFTVTTPYAFVGSPKYCLDHPELHGQQIDAGAGPKEWKLSWNGPVIDEAVSTVFHELAETMTDPYPVTGQAAWAPEIGDICAWEPGPSTLTGGVYSDLGFGEPYAPSQIGYAANQGKPYLVQTIWDPAQQGCAFGPKAYDCKTQAAACGSWQCGTAPDGCGGTYECGGCESAQTCNQSTHTCQGGCRPGFVDCGDGTCAKKAIWCG